MGSFIEQHKEVLQKFILVNAQLQRTEKELSELKKKQSGNISARISRLEEQLEKIDDYMLRIEAFRRLAEKNLESPNVPTIEASEGYRVSLNRLRRWAMMIDPTSSNDPYAQRVYMTAKCDEYFLSQKKEEFTERIGQLKSDQSSGMTKEIRRLEDERDSYAGELREIAGGSEMRAFAEAVIMANRSYSYAATPRLYMNCLKQAQTVSLGAYAYPLAIPKEHQGMFGGYYDQDSGSVWIPMEQKTEEEFAVSVLCSPGQAKKLDKALQNILLEIIERYPAGSNRIFILDGVRFNPAVLGSLRQLEDSFAVAPVPRNPEQLTDMLEQMIASLADIDDVLELSESVIEYNRSAAPDRQIPRSTVILFGWPGVYTGRDKEYLYRIMTNYERYGISFICVSYQKYTKKEQKEPELPEYAAQNAVHIRMLAKETTLRQGEDEAKAFQWHTLTDTLKEEYATSLRAVKTGQKKIGNEYLKRHPEFLSMPIYDRAYKKLELPFGIDNKDREHCVSFENENFAAYLVGASRSGKSTLLHTLIAGIISNYHPDNVELWLADFKQLEFKKYIEHCPPHVKYVLLDESPELVYDLIDKLTEKMKERQILLSRLGKERLDQIEPMRLDEPMPVIFVILDEFSIMSQAIAESQTYRLRLQNLLAKGAALGFRFLFSSQTFTTGIAGLTPTARAQIQQRITMKGSREEISETLELSLNLRTEQVRDWMDALPPHYALVKHRVGADKLPQVNRVLVMYFPDHRQIDSLIDRLNASMTKSKEYRISDIRSYVNKKTVFVDGNSYHTFPDRRMVRAVVAREKKKSTYTGEELFMVLGVPRLMSKLKPVTLSRETRENLLLIGRTGEQNCSASVLTSAIRSFLIQNGQVSVWAYGKNRLYQSCKEQVWQGEEYSRIRYSEDMDQVCGSIRKLTEKIKNRRTGDELIILIGMDRICADFEFADDKVCSSGQAWTGLDPALAVSTPEEERLWRLTLMDDDTDKVEDKPQNPGGGQAEDKPGEQDKGQRTDGQEIQPEAYNAGSDLRYIVTQGSRLGYHFLLFLNSYADLKTTTLRLDWFRHRMAFQIPVEDSREIFHGRNASELPEHVCQYYDMTGRYSFRPYLHPGIGWDGWETGEDGQAVNLYE